MRLSITLDGRLYEHTIEADATDAQIRAIAAETTGQHIPESFVIERFAATETTPESVMLRPKVPFGSGKDAEDEDDEDEDEDVDDDDFEDEDDEDDEDEDDEDDEDDE